MNKLIPVLERLLSLLVVFLLLAGTVVWSGRLFGLRIGQGAAAETVTMNAEKPDADRLTALGLTDATLQPLDSAAWEVRTAAGDEAGLLIATAPYAGDVMGFAGATPLYLYVDAAGVLKAVAAADNEESPDFFKEAVDGIFPQVVGRDVADVAARRVDAVSGATYSSNAIINNVKYALSARAKGKQVEERGPIIGWGRTVAVLAVLALGIVAARRWRGIKWARVLILVLNVGVVGFWCGQFLSLAMLRGFVQNGIEPLLCLPAVAMLLVALAMPYFGRSHHYCQWVCPYGSLQELAWRLPLPKWHVPSHVYKLMRLVRMLLLMVLLAMLWFGAGVGLLDYEPFAAFVLSTATPAVIVIAALFVVLGIFIPHPWCRCVCPVGTLLELAEDGGRKPAGRPTRKG